MTVLGRLTPDLRDERADLRPERIRKILVVRALFRMGDAILATPAIGLFRDNFPAAQIDFVGPPISRRLFENLPIDRHYAICKTFPAAMWSYIALLKRLRAQKYDLAFDASGSSAAMGAVLVGFCGARLRIGIEGRWDRWFNIRLRRPADKNKYRILPQLLTGLGLQTSSVFPEVVLSSSEIREGAERLRNAVGREAGPLVGVFVGGRKTRGKRWDKEKFADLAARLHAAGARPVIFLGPEEKTWLTYFQRETATFAEVIYEPTVRKFAALVSYCKLFVACDSGPVHLACALGIRTVAIFFASDVNRWAPPAELARVMRGAAVCVDDIFAACREEICAMSDRDQRAGARGLSMDRPPTHQLAERA
jgi:heptosyltransferase-3